MRTTKLTSCAVIAFTLCVAGCETKGTVPSEASNKKTQSKEQTPVPTTSGCEAVVELADLDHRTPVPLLPMMAWHQKQNMMEHLVAIQRIADGLAREDWEEVANASALIESSPQMQQTCQHMGAGAQGFTEMALDFHRRADAIGEAAKVRDVAAVLQATAITLQSCTGCHAAFRQEIVTASEWNQRTGQTHEPASMHGQH